jgi:L-ascorbate metabolism protein UlaG (beta-lactamase superfamily)
MNMRRVLFILLSCVALCGCEEDKGKTESQSDAKEENMAVRLQWLGHASFRLTDGADVVYIDPWKLEDAPHDATLVLVSHSHYDHYSGDDIAKVSGDKTQIIASVDVVGKQGGGKTVAPGDTAQSAGVTVAGVASYNPNKQYHPRSNDWLGFVVEIGGKRIYYAGDTDLTDEMKGLTNIDVALLPVGGTYTMSAQEAAEATKAFEPKRAIPYHWGDIVGGKSDAEAFSESAACPVTIMEPGETIDL